jgi:hypothetical protein
MKNTILFYALLFLYALPVKAQDAEHPVKWTFSLEKKSGDHYTLKATAALAPGFHIWALDPGGDGSLIPTSFELEQENTIRWDGVWQEKEKPVTHTLDFIEGAIHWHEDSVTFYRNFITDVGLPLSGKVTFQVCNGASCFPPESKSFLLQAKQ